MSAGGHLSGDELDRLAKFLGMLGSDHGGERASAALKADQLIRGNGLTWRDIIEPLKTRAQVLELRGASTLRWRQDAIECLASREAWSEREADFLLSMKRLRRTPTTKQADWLATLLERARMTRWAA